MKRENLPKIEALTESIADHEDFISQCDYFIRNVGPDGIPVIDRWVEAALRAGVLNHKHLHKIFLDMRDLATIELAALDKQLEDM